MDLPTYISLPIRQEQPLPEKYQFQDVRYTPELVKYMLSRYCPSGGTVLDPFAGFGTTLTVARDLGHDFRGIEIDELKVKYMRHELDLGDKIIHGDVKRLFLDRILPPIDLVMTSPPYMNQDDQANALTRYRYAGTYSQYLDEMGTIFSSLQTVLRDEAIIIIEIANLKHDGKLTTLAWDVARRIAEIYHFRTEIVVNWTGERKSDGIYNYGYDHSYCLIFQNGG